MAKSSHEFFVPILASGKGSTAEFVIRATQTGVLQNADTGLVISNNAKAGVFDVAGQLSSQYPNLHIQTAHIGPTPENDMYEDSPIEQTKQESEAIYELIMEQADGRPVVVLLAGYLRKLRGPTLDELVVYNTHPAALPATKGKFGRGAHRHVVRSRLSWSAQYLHRVTENYDEGPVFRKNVFPIPVAPYDASEEVIEKYTDTVEYIAQNTEKAHLPVDFNALLVERAKI